MKESFSQVLISLLFCQSARLVSRVQIAIFLGAVHISDLVLEDSAGRNFLLLDIHEVRVLNLYARNVLRQGDLWHLLFPALTEQCVLEPLRRCHGLQLHHL